MHLIQTGLIVATLAIIAFISYTKYNKALKSDGEFTDKELTSLAVQVFILLVVGYLAVSSFTYVQQGYACLVIDPITGSIKEPVLGERFFFRFPWTRTMQIYYATLSTEMWTDAESGLRGEYPAVKVLSKDGLDIEVDILIRYELDSMSLVELYRSYPDLRYEDKAISSIAREDVRDVISKYTTLEVVELREAISVDMTNKILNSLKIEPSLKGALKNVQIDLRDIDPPQSFKIAVQAKKTAEQAKLQAEHERETKLIQADASAKQAIRIAEGEAESTMIRANATKYALQTIASEIDGEVYYSLQMLKEIAPNVKYLIMTMGEDGVPVYLQAPTE